MLFPLKSNGLAEGEAEELGIELELGELSELGLAEDDGRIVEEGDCLSLGIEEPLGLAGPNK